MNLTKTVLRRPVTTLMAILCLIVFGLNSIFSFKFYFFFEAGADPGDEYADADCGNGVPGSQPR